MSNLSDPILAILRRHTIGAFNGSQVACAAPECRTWMETDAWHQHIAELIADVATPPDECPSRCARNAPCPDPWHDRRVSTTPVTTHRDDTGRSVGWTIKEADDA